MFIVQGNSNENVLGNDLFELFGLWNTPISRFCLPSKEVQPLEPIPHDWRYEIKSSRIVKRIQPQNIYNESNRM